MLREQFINNFATTLDGGINNSVTTLDLTSVTGLPSGGGYRLIIGTEIMYVVSRSSFTLTVVRGQEGTTAASHSDLDPATVILTAGALANFRLQNLAEAGLVPYEDSLSADDDEFDDENFSGWTAVATTPALVTSVERHHRFSTVLPTGTAAAQYYAWMKNKTPSAGDWVQAGFLFAGSGSQYPIPAVIMANGSTYNAGKQIVFGYSPHEEQFIIRDMTGYNTHIGFSSYGTVRDHQFGAVHMRLQFESNDHYSGFVSPDGVTWATVFNNLNLGSFGTAPSWCGFGATIWSATREYSFSTTYCRFSF